MSSTVPTDPPASDYAEGEQPLHLRSGYVWAPLRGAWLQAKPEEMVRQRFIHRLSTEYGYSLKQMAQERRTQSGRSSPKADIIVAKDEQALRENRDYILVVETKAEHVTILPADYAQGESYARAVGCEFMVAHNEKETRSFRLVPGAPGSRIDIEDAPTLSDVEEGGLDKIRRATKSFSRDEFRRLLYECHTILRDNHKLDPGSAFDEISKVLFIKMFFERGSDTERFTVSYLDEYARVRRSRQDQVMDDLFDDTKEGLQTDRLFERGDKLQISYATFRRLVAKLERFNLSSTSDDVKGIAFEQFLGQTFRGELGQYFTPRPVVDFMVQLVDPQEGELICDPACGTGGFLIRTFEYVRDAIEAAVQVEKDAVAATLESQALEEGWEPEQLSDRVEAAWHELNSALDVADTSSRLGQLSHDRFFGSDAEARAARTSKMNMIMHGDGHGGIYFHDGLLDTGGILRERFDVVLTNPPFGSTVASDQLVGDTPQTRMSASPTEARVFASQFGDAWQRNAPQMTIAEREGWAILQMFDIGRDPIAGPIGTSKVRNSRPTETLFLERAISLLRPGGRLAIVLPDGILNNPSLQWLRDYCDGIARLRAVISLPQEVFASAKATVKTSIVMLERFTEAEVLKWRQALETAADNLEATVYGERRRLAQDQFEAALVAAGIDADSALAKNEAVAAAYANRADETALKAVRSEFNKELDVAQRKTFRDALKAMRAVNRGLDAELRGRALTEARKLFDYSVFMAEADHAGITSTGATGDDVPNELPEVLKEFREWAAGEMTPAQEDVPGAEQVS